jgi:hypothetical protein
LAARAWAILCSAKFFIFAARGEPFFGSVLEDPRFQHTYGFRAQPHDAVNKENHRDIANGHGEDGLDDF